MTTAKLFESLQRRPRPESVICMILEDAPHGFYSKAETTILLDATKHFVRTKYTSMSETFDFSQSVGIKEMVDVASKAFQLEPLSEEDCLNLDKVREFVGKIGAPIQMVLGQHDFKVNRFDKARRKLAGIEISKRKYNKRVRSIRRFAERLEEVTWNQEVNLVLRLAKTSGATLLSREDLTDFNTAAFVAYMSARMNRRSVFTNQSQDRAYDGVADILLKKMWDARHTNWYAVAMVHPESDVLQRLSEEERGRLLGMWTSILGRIAKLLQTVAEENNFNMTTMVVQWGNDSSTWNAAAGAWNKARDQWISLVYSLGLHALLNSYCPGKVMRLMAGDVASWHSRSGGGLHPDTQVWARLPRPWEVFNDQKQCGADLVRAACEASKAKVEGWVLPPPKKIAVETKPTPELVHGVTISNPYLAAVLKKAGYFSGKLTTPAQVGV